MMAWTGARRGGVIVSTFVTALLAACGPNVEGELTWTKPGTAEAQERQDFLKCGGELSPNGTPRVRVSQVHEVDKCMRANGYEVDKAE